MNVRPSRIFSAYGFSPSTSWLITDWKMKSSPVPNDSCSMLRTNQPSYGLLNPGDPWMAVVPATRALTSANFRTALAAAVLSAAVGLLMSWLYVAARGHWSRSRYGSALGGNHRLLQL